jgi:hypothetical protein
MKTSRKKKGDGYGNCARVEDDATRSLRRKVSQGKQTQTGGRGEWRGRGRESGKKANCKSLG